MAGTKGRGGARKGAGRPAYSKGRSKLSYFSTRITQRTRDLLEAEARIHGESLAVVAERLLQIGLDEKAKRRNRIGAPLRALCFLIEKLNEGRYEEKYPWRSNPYMFEAFRTAVLDVLDELRPPGEIVKPPLLPLRHSTVPGNQIPDDPSDYGHERAGFLLSFLYSINEQIRYGILDNVTDFPPETRQYILRHVYGLTDALKDLGLRGVSFGDHPGPPRPDKVDSK